MERNEETLSTRDLAAPNEPAQGVATAEGDVRDAAVPDGQRAVYEQSHDEPSRLGADEDAQLVTDERTAAPQAHSTEAVTAQDQDTGAAPASSSTAVSDSDAGVSLLSAEMDATFQQRWKDIQTRFVDEPRGAVEDADGLVANLMQQLADGFAKERERLEAQWGRGEDISTEDLRIALQRYRTFFQRLLST